ncbi:MAG: hypothetical protein FH758_12880 [Firmicutes bacterium]|nr:hypothetical protein [Bacillota bacterium]
MIQSASRQHPTFAVNKRVIKLRRVKVNLLDEIVNWLEKEDSNLARLSAYTVCTLSAVVFISSAIF